MTHAILTAMRVAVMSMSLAAPTRAAISRPSVEGAEEVHVLLGAEADSTPVAEADIVLGVVSVWPHAPVLDALWSSLLSMAVFTPGGVPDTAPPSLIDLGELLCWFMPSSAEITLVSEYSVDSSSPINTSLKLLMYQSWLSLFLEWSWIGAITDSISMDSVLIG